MNAYSYFSRSFPTCSDSNLIETDRGELFSYADLESETARYASFFTSLGMKAGDRVAAQIDKSPQALFLYLGVLRAGLCYLPLNIAYQRGELGYFLGDAEPSVVICRSEMDQLFTDLVSEHNVGCLFTFDDIGGGSLCDAMAGVSAQVTDCERQENDLAVIIYTSGTTGRSKGAMVTHGNLISNAQVLHDYWRFTSDDVLLHALPIFHVHGLFVAVHPILLAGARILFYRNFDAKVLILDMPRATMMMGVPTFYTRLLAEPDFIRDICRRMRLFISGSAPLLLDTFNEFRRRSGHTILERYGMSEAGMITSNPFEGERHGGTVGRPLPGVSLRVMDALAQSVEGDMPGDIQIKGPNVFSGYWRMPEKTAEEFTADGWFRTGDVGQWDSEGYLSIVGRAKDLIISGGFNVYPKEVELLIDAMSGVVESAVIGIPHPDFGEVAAAVVVRLREATLDEAQVIAHLKLQIAGFKVPKRVSFVDDLPRNAMGKIQKSLLREQF